MSELRSNNINFRIDVFSEKGQTFNFAAKKPTIILKFYANVNMITFVVFGFGNSIPIPHISAFVDFEITKKISISMTTIPSSIEETDFKTRPPTPFLYYKTVKHMKEI